MTCLSRPIATGRMSYGDGTLARFASASILAVSTFMLLRKCAALSTANLGIHPGVGNSFI